jgi:hypothetical protein
MVVSWLSLVSLTRSRGFGPVHMHVCLQACLSFARTYYDRHIGERVCERLGAGFIFSKMVAMTWWDGHTNSLSAFGISNQMSTLRCWFRENARAFSGFGSQGRGAWEGWVCCEFSLRFVVTNIFLCSALTGSVHACKIIIADLVLPICLPFCLSWASLASRLILGALHR